MRRPVHDLLLIAAAFVSIAGAVVAAKRVDAGAEATPSESKETPAMTHRVETGTLGQASFMLALPGGEPAGLFVYNHGYRTRSQRLSAEFDPTAEPFASALAKGFIVAASSYRRNGWIVCDAVDDVQTLIAYVSERYGPFERVFVAGESMGGAVALRMLEGEPGRYAGALVLGDGLFSTDDGESTCPSLSGALGDPVLVVTNRSEAERPRRYVESVAAGADVQPVLWVVDRDGHVNFAAAELNTMLGALLAWMDHGAVPEARTFAIASAPDSTATFDGCCRASAAVQAVDPNFGNLTAAFTAADLDRLGIAVGDDFALGFEGKTVEVRRVTTYGDVERGRWLALVDGEGFLQIAINYGDAAATLGVESGDAVTITAKAAGPAS